MRKQISILTLLFMLINTLASSMVVQPVNAEDLKHNLINLSMQFSNDGQTFVNLEEASGEGEIQVSWQASVLGDKSKSVALPENITITGEKEGDLIAFDQEDIVGSYDINEENILTLSFQLPLNSEEYVTETDSHSEPHEEEQIDNDSIDRQEDVTVRQHEQNEMNEGVNHNTLDTFEGLFSILVEVAEDNEAANATDNIQGDRDELGELNMSEIEDDTKDIAVFSGVIETNIITGFELRKITDGTPPEEWEILNPDEEIIINQPYADFEVQLQYLFELPAAHTYGEGSSFVIDVSEQFSVPLIVEPQPLKRVDGTLFGHFVTSGNNIIITFNNAIESGVRTTGNIVLQTAFDEDYEGPSLDNPIRIPISGEEEITYPVRFIPTGAAIDKSAEPNRTFNTEVITWSVDFNKNLAFVSDAVLDDDLIEGQHSYIDGTFKLYELIMNSDGSSVLGEEIDTEINEFPINLGDIDRAYRLVYQTEINDSEGTRYRNQAVLSGRDIQPVLSSATVDVGRGEPLKKEAINYDGDSQVITWQIRYNFDEKEIFEGFLKDIFGNNQQLVQGSLLVEKVTLDQTTGDAIGFEEVTEGFTLDGIVENDKNGFLLTFDDVLTDAYQVTYQTEIEYRVLDGFTVTNTVTDGENTDTDNQTIGQGVFRKDNYNADYAERDVQWRLSVNRDRYPMDNLVIEDRLPEGLTLISSRAATQGADPQNSWNETISFDSEIDGVFTDSNDQFDFSYNANTGEVRYEFKDVVTEHIYIYYKTSFNLGVTPSEQEGYQNNATIFWDDLDGNDYTKDGVSTFRPDDHTRNNGYKFGRYDAINKEITWQVGINHNLQNLESVEVIEEIETIQNLKFDSISVYDMILLPGANEVRKGELKSTDDFGEDFISETSDGFTVNLGDINSGYIIEFKTSLKEEQVEAKYENTASVVTANPDDDLILDAELSVNFGGQYTTKRGQQNTANPRLVNWRVQLNYSQSKLDNFQVTDTVSLNQTFVQDSLKVYGTSIVDSTTLSHDIVKDSDNKLVVGEDYNIVFSEDEHGQASFSLEFTRPIEEPYVLEYDTYLLYEGDGIVSNKVTFSGEQVSDPEGENTTVSVNFARISGSIDGEIGRLVINKVDSENLDVRLEGAAFHLYDETGEVLLRSGVTDENGHLAFNNLLHGAYQLVEVNAPMGYVIDRRIGNTQSVEVNAEITEIDIENFEIKRDINLIKIDGTTGNELTGVVFELYQEGEDTPLDSYTTDETGEIYVKDLNPGDYYFIEVVPKEDYKKSEGRYSFTIRDDHIILDIETIVVENDLIPGSAYMMKIDADKVDEDNNGLGGATFLIKNIDEDPSIDFERTVTSGVDGKIETGELRPGNYSIEEVAAPHGYELSENNLPIIFEIDRSQSEELDLGIVNGAFENNVKRTSIELTKTDSINGQLIAGAEFEITYKEGDYNLNPTSITGVTNQEGVLRFEDLKPGIYTINEINTPDGYITSDEEIEVEITLDDVANGDVLEINVQNDPLADIRLTKVDAETRTPLEGAVFAVDYYNPDNPQLREPVAGYDRLVTDKDGRLSITGLKADNYIVYETQAPDGYLIQEGGFEFIVSAEVSSTELIEIGEVDNDIILGAVRLIKTDGQMGQPLEGVVFELSANNLVNGGTYDTTTHTTDEFGEIVVNNLRPGTYQFTEVAPLEGYQAHVGEINVEINFPHDEEIAEVNVMNYPLVSVPVEKVWNDNNQIDKRPESITVELFSNGVRTEKTLELSADNDWQGTFEDLNAVDLNSEFYTYTVNEAMPVDGYQLQSIEGNQSDGYIIRNVETMDLEIEKQWLDESTNQRPETIEVKLYQNEAPQPFRTLTITGNNDWNAEFIGLPKYASSGEAYRYRIEESIVPGYALSSINESSAGFVIENVRIGETSITGQKTWLDDNDINRPESIKVHLLQNDEVYRSQTITPEDNWVYHFDELDAFDSEGKSFNYRVEEEPIAGYVVSYEETIDGYDITNLRSGTIDVSGEKTWLDDNSSDRPESITVNLLQNGEKVDKQIVTATDDWAYSFVDLAEYDEQGVAYNYTLTEESVEGYETTVTGFNITNLRVGETSVEGKKTWLDDDSPNRPESITVNLLQNGDILLSKEVTSEGNWLYRFDGLDGFDDQGQPYIYTVEEESVEGYDVSYQETELGYDITNLRVDTLEVSGEKTWLDGEALDRPETITVNLLRNGEKVDEQIVTANDEWSYRFTDLEKYDNQGVSYTYTITEAPVEGYQSTITGYNIENLRVGTHVIEGEKIWRDDDPTGRPTSIIVNLLQNGIVIDSMEVSQAHDWMYQFTDLSTFDASGVRYEYTITEQGVPGYRADIDGYNIINTRTDVTEVSVTKGWLDDESSSRPTEVTVYLLRNGERINSAMITSDLGWTYTFEGLAAYDEFGQAYVYTLEERPVPGYDTIINGYDITNLRVGKVDVSGEKTWLDDNSSDRPESITVNLLQNGEKVDKQIVTAADDWAYSFVDLAEYDEQGVAYTYTLTEEPIEGYETTVTDFNITNLRVGETSVEGKKIWVGDHPLNRPEWIAVNLLQNGYVIATRKVGASDSWRYHFNNLAMYDEEGVLYQYTVEEEPVEGYNASVDGYNIINTKILTMLPEEPEAPSMPIGSGTLPNTATTLYQYLLMGMIFMAIGGMSLIVTMRKKDKSNKF